MQVVDTVLTQIERAIVIVTLSVASLLGLMQVVLRYGFSTGFEWTEGITIALVIWGSLVGASIAARERIHIRLDLVVDLMPGPLRRTVEIGAVLVSVFFIGYVLILAVQFEVYLYGSGMESLMTYLPEWVTFLGAPVALSMLFVRYVQTLIRVIRGEKMGGSHSHEQEG